VNDSDLSSELEILSKSQRWHIDGTFDASPKQFYQVYTIHGWLFDEMHICAFIMLINKKQRLYGFMFQGLIKSAKSKDFILKPQLILRDFELAAINAIKTSSKM
jgi:hypothetical protein